MQRDLKALLAKTRSNGANGADGKTILNGTNNPTSGIGNNGDFYLNTSTNTLFGPKAAGTWPASGTSLVGPAGSIGPKGDKGDTGAAGPPGTGISGGTTPGQLLLWNGSSWLPINPGTAGQALTICNGLPTWTSNGICPASSLPSLSTSAPVSITSTSATSGGNITNDGGGSIITRGVCWSTTQNPTTSLSTKTDDGGGAGNFNSSLSGLAPGTSYFVRAYATNTIGTAYGDQKSFTTQTQLADITTAEVSSISATGAVSGGNITADGGAPITTRGVCWSTSPNPTTALSTKIISGSGTGVFSSTMSGLAPGTFYYVRAFAINIAGTSYGNEISFATPAVLPTISTNIPTNISNNSAVSGGSITSDGGSEVFARGICWSQTPNPDLSSQTTNDGGGSGSFSSAMSSLFPGVTYYVRAYATNSVGTAYGSQQSFATLPQLADLYTIKGDITSTTATLGGNIFSSGGAAITARGVCWSTSPNPTIALSTKTSNGTGTGSYFDIITDLSIATTYYVRAYAINSAGISYGEEVSFKTLAVLATITTNPVTAITSNSATFSGNISFDGGAEVTVRGFCLGNSPNLTLDFSYVVNCGAGSGSFSFTQNQLTPNTLYYLRAFAINSIGVSYGNEISFSTPTYSYFVPGNGVADIDGNAYQTIILGMQEWMKENLKTSKYRNGNSITTNLTDIDWQNTTSGAYAIFNNDAANNTTYGKLYNWYAVTDPRGLCPAGWHVPSDAEWTTLENFLGGALMAGGTMKSTGTIEAGTGLWYSPNQDATNGSGFTGLPGGLRAYHGTYFGIGNYGEWWSSTEHSSTLAWIRFLGYDFGYSTQGSDPKANGCSVRCLRD